MRTAHGPMRSRAGLWLPHKTVENIRERLVTEGFNVTLRGKPHARRPKLLTGDQEAKLIATRLSSPPKGYADWTLQLLADRIVELRIVPAISTQTVRRTLKKRHNQPQD